MKTTFYLIFTSFLFSSCSIIVNSSFKSMGFYEKEVEIVKLIKEGKEIVFLPMKHVGPPEFYESLTHINDSLKSKSYFFFLEGVGAEEPQNESDSLKLDTIARKMRKMWGRSLSYNSSKGGRFDTINYTYYIGNRKIQLKEKVIIQPPYETLGLDTLSSRNVDVDANKYVNAFESKFTKVILDSCDLHTPFSSEYPCNAVDWKYRKNLRKEITLNFRNEFVVNEILKSTQPKIAIIYGSAHVEGMVKLLKAEGYEIVE